MLDVSEELRNVLSEMVLDGLGRPWVHRFPSRYVDEPVVVDDPELGHFVKQREPLDQRAGPLQLCDRPARRLQCALDPPLVHAGGLTATNQAGEGTRMRRDVCDGRGVRELESEGGVP